jgi:hypothetical protein
MEFISSLFSYKRSEVHQFYFNKLPIDVQKVLSTKSYKDQEKLLTTFSKQSDERITLFLIIFSQQPTEVIEQLFTKEIRLLNALLKIDTEYISEYSTKPEVLRNMIMKNQ